MCLPRGPLAYTTSGKKGPELGHRPLQEDMNSQTEVGRTATCGTGECDSYWVLVDGWCWWGDQDQIWFSQVYEETGAVSESVPRH